MERKRLEKPTKITVAGNRDKLRRALRSRNHIDAAAVVRPQPAGGAS